jgi:iron-sulfur cluster assembly accessory protein
MRPPRPLLTLTHRAAAALQSVIANQGLGATACVRASVVRTNWGFEHKLDLDEVIDLENDVVFSVEGLTVVVDRDSAPLLEGATLDYQAGGVGGRGFTFDNPNQSATTQASDPGQLTLSRDRARRLLPELFQTPACQGELEDTLRALQKHLMNGDSRAAVVVSAAPLLVAAYTDELDCVALLRFPGELVSEYGLRVGSRLLTVNTYDRGGRRAGDLEPGPGTYDRYTNFAPLIADFLSEETARLQQRKQQIDEAEWQRAYDLGRESLRRHGRRARDGSPLQSWRPA